MFKLNNLIKVELKLKIFTELFLIASKAAISTWIVCAFLMAPVAACTKGSSRLFYK
jgi:hypothetical protein